MIRNIIFDFGGVIAPIDRDRAVQAFIRLGLKDADSRLDKYHQTGIFQQLEEGTLTEQEFRETLGQLCGRPLTFEEVKEAWMGFFSGGRRTYSYSSGRTSPSLPAIRLEQHKSLCHQLGLQ